MRRMKMWTVQSNRILVIVPGIDQWEAFDALRAFPISDFGLITVAKAQDAGDGGEIATRTSKLFVRWGRWDDARAAIRQAISEGLPDTSRSDGLLEDSP